ncbi:hypothetical protein ACSVDE_02805 [Pseudalkalibacillus sp. Hm43]|uniref:hypothetical protein n=1 Tax=Pseudalkalibacillus sp. Hm43 TaxID=3450742 RepID=UPI003F41E23C
MKKSILCIFLFALLSGCNNEKVLEPDTAMNAATLMKHRMNIENYEAFKQLFHEASKGEVTMEEFDELGKLTTASTDFREHMLVTFTNGEMLLVEFAPKLEDDEHYQIVDVKPVPDDVKAFFER